MNSNLKAQPDNYLLAASEQPNSLSATLAASTNFVASELPRLNEQVASGLITSDSFIGIVKPEVDLLCDAIGSDVRCNFLSREDARSAIKLLGFLISSAEKHSQEVGRPEGEALSMLGSAEKMLLELAPVAGHPPRDSAYTYWIWNNSTRPLTFTGSDQEAKFNEVINKSDRAFKETSELLRPISKREVSLDEPLAEELLRHSAARMATLRDDFMSLMRHKNGPHSERALEPMFFMTKMRLFLIGYPIGGREWEGVSAANLASQMSVDFLIGTTDDEYFEHVKGRFEYFPEEELAALEADMKGDSVLSVFLNTLGSPRAAFEDGDEATLRTLVSSQSQGVRQSLIQYKGLVKAAGHLTASHWSLIDNYLLKPSKKLSNTEHAHLTVDPEQGTSGMSMEDVKRIREMRRNHSIATRLIACV